MHKDSAEVLVVFFHAVVDLFYFRLLQEPQHVFFQLSGSFAGNYFHQGNLFIDGFFHHPVKLGVYRAAFVKNFM